MVKVLVATKERQGERHDDYSWAVEGELVYVPIDSCESAVCESSACDSPECGCSLGFAGMGSGQATTTALVVERLDLGLSDLSTALSDSLERQGLLSGRWTDEDEDVFRRLFQRLLVSASHFPVGSILERDGHMLHRRAQTEPLRVPGPAELSED
jgi:hypothetical protein